jgi:hypothetical protein
MKASFNPGWQGSIADFNEIPLLKERPGEGNALFYTVM